MGDGLIDAAQPEALMYEPTRDGRLKLVGVEYIVLAQAWDAAYALHVWAWKANPHGMFVDWNPKVSCEDAREAAPPVDVP